MMMRIMMKQSGHFRSQFDGHFNWNFFGDDHNQDFIVNCYIKKRAKVFIRIFCLSHVRQCRHCFSDLINQNEMIWNGIVFYLFWATSTNWPKIDSTKCCTYDRIVFALNGVTWKRSLRFDAINNVVNWAFR